MLYGISVKLFKNNVTQPPLGSALRAQKLGIYLVLIQLILYISLKSSLSSAIEQPSHKSGTSSSVSINLTIKRIDT